MFRSDHGFHLGKKNHWQKATLWEEGTHANLMIRAPGVTQEGEICKRFVSLLDLYPTLADLCGLEAPGYLDGRSLLPLLKNPESKWESTAITGLTSKQGLPDWLPYISIRNEMGRYIRYTDGQEEFYDSNKDPHEWTNEINNPAYAKVIDKMRTKVPAPSELAVPLPNFVDQKK